MADLPSGTGTYLLTDIEGSTPLWEQDPRAMRVAVARHHALLRGAIEANHGQVFNIAGDAFCADFATANDALAAALAAQQALSQEACDQTPLRVRMGLHRREADAGAGDYRCGPTLNRGARLMRNHGNRWSRGLWGVSTFASVVMIGMWLLTWHVSARELSAPPIAAPTGPQSPATTKTINFANYTWSVRSGSGAPGPNIWDDTNASLDSQGFLHLKLTHVVTAWHSVELYTTARLGFGRYQFDVVGQIDQLDPNVVLGLFNYPPPDVGPDGTNEIDMEFARWGVPTHPNGNYTVWPAQTGLQRVSKTFEFTLTEITTTQQFTWAAPAVSFRSAQGPASDQAPPFAQWLYQPIAFAQDIPQQALPLHINLWLFNGAAPTNGQEVEIIISRFAFTPFPRLYLPIVHK